MSGRSLTYSFSISPELVNLIENARKHHQLLYGETGINSTFELFFAHMIGLYIDDDDNEFVDDALIDLCTHYNFSYNVDDDSFESAPSPDSDIVGFLND